MNEISEQQKMIIKLMMIALRIQAETSYCVFMRYAGHVDEFSVTIAKSKSDFNSTIASCGIGRDRGIDEIKKAIDTLLTILDGNEFEDTDCEYEEYIVKEYYF